MASRLPHHRRENADEMRMGNDGKPVFRPTMPAASGGISTVSDRCALRRQADLVDPDAAKSIDKDGNDVEIMTKGRTIHASASAPCRSASYGCLRNRRSLSASSRTDRKGVGQ
jgi:hypothetical protein